MSSRATKVSAILGVGILVAMAGVVSAQQPSSTTSTQKGASQTQTSSQSISGTIVYVDGNRVTVRNAAGNTAEYTVPDGFKFQADHKDIGVADLKPGMKVSATVTTTVTTTPVTVTEVRKGTILNVTGSTVIVRGPAGVRKFTQADLEKRHIKLMKDGQPTDIQGFQAGDHFTAVIVTDAPPEVVSEREAKAYVKAAPAPAPAPALPSSGSSRRGSGARSGSGRCSGSGSGPGPGQEEAPQDRQRSPARRRPGSGSAGLGSRPARDPALPDRLGQLSFSRIRARRQAGPLCRDDKAGAPV